MISDVNLQYNARFIGYGRVHDFIDATTKKAEQANVTYVGDVAVKYADPASTGARTEHRFRVSVFDKSFDLSKPVSSLSAHHLRRFMTIQLDEQTHPLHMIPNKKTGKFMIDEGTANPRTLTSCGGNCTVTIQDNMVSFKSLVLPFWFFFTVEYNKHNEIFLNTKIEVNRRATILPTKDVHGLLGQTYHGHDSAVTAGIDEYSDEEEIASSTARKSDVAHHVAAGSSDRAVDRDRASHTAVWHREVNAGEVDFDFVDSQFLQGHLYDYELKADDQDQDQAQSDAIWGDFFKFNRYYTL
jgi:hypothetical protein